MLLYRRGAILIIVSKIFKYITKRTHKSIQEDNTYRYIAPIYVTVHGKTYVNDLSFKGKNQRTTNEQRTNVSNVSTNYPNVPSIWTEKYERLKAKIRTIF